MMKGLSLHWKTEKRTILILGAILSLAIFLRVYHFHDWLHFGSDQARDLELVGGVVDQGRPWPLLGADASNTHFKLGPAYHYFQIIAVMLFGNDPSVMAYPDLLFSLFAIPLFFAFLRKYFDESLSLILVFLYAVSFFSVEFSRFAWNPNPLPFFVALFLLSALRFLEDGEETPWIWAALLGIAIGIGIQLHTLLLLLMPAFSVLTFAFLLRRNWRVMRQMMLVLAVVLVCNAGQIRGEMRSGGENTKRFLAAFTDRSDGGGGRTLINFRENILNHAQANGHMISSLGEKGHFTFATILSYPGKAKGVHGYAWFVVSLIISLTFSLFGYGFLLYRSFRETDTRKKYFLRLILLFVTLSFIILFPIARGAPMRYFYHTIFVPFIFLGLFFEWLRMHFPRWHRIVIFGTVLFLFAANAYTMGAEARELSRGMRGDSGFVVLGEAERMVDSMIARSVPSREAYLLGRSQYISTYYKSLSSLAAKEGFSLKRMNVKNAPSVDAPYFFISQSGRSMELLRITGYELAGSESFGRIGLYQLKRAQ